jgi:uncharacterized protein YdaU (DUF1376 family)
MADFPSMPLLTDAYIADTQHLTNEEHGIYLRLLMFAWRTKSCSLQNDDRRLATMVGVTPNKWAKLKPIIMEFWTLVDDAWVQKKLTSQRAFVEKSRKQKSNAGKASAKAKSLKSNKPVSTAEPTAEPTVNATARQQSITITKTKERDKSLSTPIPPEGDLQGEFVRFWEYYPRKVGKGAAEKAFIKARKNTSLAEIAMPLKAFKAATAGTEISKIPHPSTWLNQSRWLDDQSHANNGHTTSEADLASLGATSANADMASLFGGSAQLPPPSEDD